MRQAVRRLLFLLSLWVLTISVSYANWATLADMPTKETCVQEIVVHQDGTHEGIIETKTEILTEIGRESAAQEVLFYKEDSEKIEVLSAKTIYQGKTHDVDKSLLEDKPLASTPQGFEQTRQILIAFPMVNVGAVLYLKYKYKQKKPILNGVFGRIVAFGKNTIEEGSRVKITSALPLNILVNDPERCLSVVQTKKRDTFLLDIKQKHRIYKMVVNEPPPGIINPKKLTWVSVATQKKWEEFAAQFGKLVAPALEQQLPKEFVQILKRAQQQKDAVSQINAVTSLLNEKVRYLGEWRTIKGQYIPRDLDVINKTNSGDCKDFSVVTAIILNHLGFKAQLAAVMRGTFFLGEEQKTLPNFSAFNHMIVKVTDKHGKVRWIDPTNFVSMAGGIFPDIADRMAVVLDAKQPSYEKIPAVDPKHAKAVLHRQLEIKKDNKILETGNLTLQHEEALGLTGIALRVSDDLIKRSLFYGLAGHIDLDTNTPKTMQLPDLRSRNVHDITIRYSFERNNALLKTNMGAALNIPQTLTVTSLCNISQDFVTNVFVRDKPATLERRTVIKNIKITNAAFLNDEIKTPWIYVKRSGKINPDGNLQIDEIFTIYKNQIPDQDFKKPEFLALKTWLKDNFKDVVLVLT